MRKDGEKYLYDELKNYLQVNGYKSYGRQNIKYSGKYEAVNICLSERYSFSEQLIPATTLLGLVYEYFQDNNEVNRNNIEFFLNNYEMADIYYAFIEKLKVAISEEIILIQDVYKNGIVFATKSNSVGEIKLGLSLLRLSNEEEAVEVFKTFSIHNDYSFFCIEAMKEFKGSNTFTFNLAKIAKGYGRIIAISKLEVISDAIRNWIIEKGCDNNFMEDELATLIFNKVDISWYIQNTRRDSKKFNVLSKIIIRLYRGNDYFSKWYNYDLFYEYVHEFKKYGKTFNQLYSLVAVLISIEDYNKDSILESIEVYNDVIKETTTIVEGIEEVLKNDKWIEVLKNEIEAGKISSEKLMSVGLLLKSNLDYDDMSILLERDVFDEYAYKYIMVKLLDEDKIKLIDFVEKIFINNKNLFSKEEIEVKGYEEYKEDRCLEILISYMNNLTIRYLDFNIKALTSRNRKTKRKALKNLRMFRDDLDKVQVSKVKEIADEEWDKNFSIMLLKLISESIGSNDIIREDISKLKVIPHIKDVYLTRTMISGLDYGAIAKSNLKLERESVVYLKRERDNQYDRNAIAVVSKTGWHIGYIPRRENYILKNLMDSNKKLYGLVEEVDNESRIVKIQVYLSYSDVEEEVNDIIKLILAKKSEIIN